MALTKLNNQSLTAVTSAGLPSGTVLQVVQGVKSDTSVLTSTTFTDIGLSANITPSSASSKILVSVQLWGYSGHYVSPNRLMRGTTQIGVAPNAGNRPSTALPFSLPPSGDGPITVATVQVLDSPATTSQITYKVQSAARADGTQSSYINRSESDRDTASYDPRTVSYITLTEIAG
jgi:hypothetical protein